MLLINKQKKIIFEISAKSNCTVITKMFFNYIGQLERALKFSSWIHNYRIKYSRRQKVNEIYKNDINLYFNSN